MENNRPIGVFDSGLGGLTAMTELKKLLPDENFIYFGDSARIPYGTKSPEVITRFALQDMRFLASEGVKAILVACGSVSSNCLPVLRAEFGKPLFGVVEAAAEAAAKTAKAKNGRIAVLGTSATVHSNAFPKALSALGSFEIMSVACPMFVPLVENGHTNADDVAATAIAESYLAPIAEFKPDAVILGCTHYPLLSDVISKFLGDSVLISSGKEAAKALAYELKSLSLLGSGGGKTVYCTSDDPALFVNGAKPFLGIEIDEEVRRIDIEKY